MSKSAIEWTNSTWNPVTGCNKVSQGCKFCYADRMAKRLKAIEEYSHLGAGFRIALRDLEIRGAGNILGPEQSGHIQLVGYQMYCELLAEAVKRLKQEPVQKIPTAVVDLGFATFIPKSYIPINRYRMDIYRKIAVAKIPEDLRQIENELDDVLRA